MRCIQARRLLDEYRDGELLGPRRSQCEAHLRSCVRCSEALRERNDLSAILRGWDGARSSDELTARVMTAWQTAWPREWRLAYRRSIAARAAVAAGAVALTVVVGFAGVRAIAAVRKVSARPADEAGGIYGPLDQVSGLKVSDSGYHELGG